jgi:hypothetical protein
MTLRLSSHLYARAGAAFFGFFGGGALFTLFVFGRQDVPFGFTPFLFFGLIFGGMYLAQLAFTLLVPAMCPACGGASAFATVRRPAIYVCRACGAVNDASRAMLAEQLASMQSQAVKQEKSGSRLGWVFVAVGVACTGAGAWLAQDAIALQRDGISTEARVARVTQRPTFDSEGAAQTTYTASVQYQAGNDSRTLTRSWSVPVAGHCVSPCYQEGEQLKVIYMPGDPTRAKVHSLSELFMAPAIFGTVGIVFAAFGVLAIRYQRRRERERLAAGAAPRRAVF